MGLCLLVLRMEGLQVLLSGLFFPTFLPDFSSGLFFRASLLGLLRLVRVNCYKLYRMVL